METEITIEGKSFHLVKHSKRSDVGVYSSGELFVRVGEMSVIDEMVKLHKKFDEFGFPVPEIVGRGEIAGQGYFLEKSFGEKCFSYLFKYDIEKHGQISPELFEKFVAVSEKFARAQIRSVWDSSFIKGRSLRRNVGESTRVCEGEGFQNPPSHQNEPPPFTKEEFSDTVSVAGLVRPEDLAGELPEHREKILKLFDESVKAMSRFPVVLTHGDFNPHNLFPDGVIDFEKPYHVSVGYDLVTNIFHANYFPRGDEYSYSKLYFFSQEHERLYYERIDAVFVEAGLPKLSDYKKHFEYCRAVWLTARNEATTEPGKKFQQWRYELFKKSYLS